METFLTVVVALGLVGVAVVLGNVYAVCRAGVRERDRLRAKYKDEVLVDELMTKTLWQGEIYEQLTDSLGAPLDVDETVLKTKRKQIWKYEPDGRDRYRLGVTLEDGIVVSWDQR